MKIGAMNNPQRDLYQEIKFIAENNFDFLDLTIEPDKAYADDVDIQKIIGLKKKYGFEIIGHTPWNLPLASPFKSVMDSAYLEFSKCVRVFSKLGVKLVNIHPFLPTDMSDPTKIIECNIDFIKKASKDAKNKDMTLMVENTKAIFNDLQVIAAILREVPAAKLHWDIGHANIGNEGEKKTQLAFQNFRNKIVHMHVSDNFGQEDQHLPLGAGNINWAYMVKTLKEFKYDRTITIEVHSPDLAYLLISRDKLAFMLNAQTKEVKNGSKVL